MTELPANVQRIAVLHSSQWRERCVLAVSQGPAFDKQDVDPNHSIAMVSFAKLGNDSWHPWAEGYLVMPILHQEATVHQSKWAVFATAGEALAALDTEKAALLAAGWVEGEFDPIGDPD